MAVNVEQGAASSWGAHGQLSTTLHQVFSYVAPRDILRAKNVCRAWNAALTVDKGSSPLASYAHMARAILRGDGANPDRCNALTAETLHDELQFRGRLNRPLPEGSFSPTPQGPTALRFFWLAGAGLCSLSIWSALSARGLATFLVPLSLDTAQRLSQFSSKAFKFGILSLLVICPEGVRKAWVSPSRGAARGGRILRELSIPLALVSAWAFVGWNLQSVAIGSYLGRVDPIATSLARSKASFHLGIRLLGYGGAALFTFKALSHIHPVAGLPNHPTLARIGALVTGVLFLPQLYGIGVNHLTGLFATARSLLSEAPLDAGWLVRRNVWFAEGLANLGFKSLKYTSFLGPAASLRNATMLLSQWLISFPARWNIQLYQLDPASYLESAQWFLKASLKCGGGAALFYTAYKMTEDQPLTRSNRGDFDRLLTVDIPRAAAQGIFPTRKEAKLAYGLVTKARAAPHRKDQCALLWGEQMTRVRMEAARQAAVEALAAEAG